MAHTLKPSTRLTVGAWVKTNYSGGHTIHQIVEKLYNQRCESGIMFRVTGKDMPLLDAHWFWPCNKNGR